MNESNAPSARGTLCGRLSLKTIVLVCLNAAVLLVLGGAMVAEYYIERSVAVESARTSLSEQAASLRALLMRERATPAGIQDTIDTVCAQMRQQASPGHHIVVEHGGAVYQSSGHHEPSQAMVEAIRQGAAQGGQADTSEGRIVVGRDAGDRITVYTAEFQTNIQADLATVLRRRGLTVLILAVVLAALVNLLASRLVYRPLDRVVGALQRIRQGRLDTRLGCTGTREFQFLGREIDRMASQLESNRKARRLRMDRARRIQQNLLPELNDRIAPGVAALYEPADDVAGDTYDVVRLDDDRLLLAVADVSGHGVGAAMGAAMLKTLLNEAVHSGTTPGEMMAQLNQGFMRVTLEDEFATMVLAVWDRRRNALEVAVAGHEPPAVVRADGTVETLAPDGMPLGVDAGTWRTQSVALHPGDLLALLTDGLVEAASPEGQPFGRDRLTRLLATLREEPVGRAARTIMDAVDDHRGGREREDDMTLVLFAP